MSVVQDDFYVVGGALRHSAPCYVARQADRELYEGLGRREFCFVLTPRQMGKSSLMVHTAVRLQQEGVQVVALDLTAIGQNLHVDQWYSGLLSVVGEQTDLEDELDEFWDANTHLGPLHRWMQAIRQVVLPRCATRMVIFVDEIDVVRSLPFSTDEFFAAIRSCYNRRTEDPELERLTFCLLGVAAPTDLIRDVRMTPFNIGRRIELHDFTPAEAAPLKQGLMAGQEADRALERILFWTGGHPYLTQRLCRLVAQEEIGSQSDVDRLCHAAFLSEAAREQDSNLVFVRQRVLQSDCDLAGLLDIYSKVHRGKNVASDDRNDLHGVLRLAGLVRVEDGRLRVHNRIYRHVFDRQWIQESMPDAELRRQKAAFRRGLFRAGALASVIVAALTALALVAVNERNKAVRANALLGHALRDARQAEKDAKQAEKHARQAEKKAETKSKEAQDALAIAKTRRLEAEQAEAKAIAASRALEDAVRVAEQKQQDAERAEKDAVRANQELLAALDRETLAKQQAREEQQLAERRGQLFAELLPWLQRNASQGVMQYVDSLRKQGKSDEALTTCVVFCDLVLGDKKGFLASELLNLDQFDLEVLDLNAEVAEATISVPAESLLNEVLAPAIQIGERLVTDDATESTKKQLARLYGDRARLLQENSDKRADSDQSPVALVFASYDRAVELDPRRYRYYVGRAGAQFRLPGRRLDAVLQDLQKAIELYPAHPEPPADGEPVSSEHRRLAELYHAAGNVIQYLADQEEPGSDRTAKLDEARQNHEQAHELDPHDPRYLVGIARTLPKRSENLRRAVTLLERARALDENYPEPYNALGEIYVLEGKIREAEKAFETAIEKARAKPGTGNLYRYYCNLSSASLRGSAGMADYETALQAAQQAIQLEPSDADGHHYSGLSLYRLQRTGEAIQAFQEALARNPEHIGAMVARAQAIFEIEDATKQQVEQANADIAKALKLVKSPGTPDHQKAKTYYVYGIAWLSHVARIQDDGASLNALEEGFLTAQRNLVTASKLAPAEYAEAARRLFNEMTGHTWQDPRRREQWEQLQDEFRRLDGKSVAAGE